MNCPVCKGKDARRSRRQFTADFLLSVLGVYPWRCRNCQARFHARLMPLNDSLYVHCPICGNPALKRISAEHVDTPLAFAWRLFRVPAYRCEPCRHKYFSIRLQRSAQRAVAELSSAD
jgi:C4-type Zn-finger protein